jgi:hypothetical protein
VIGGENLTKRWGHPGGFHSERKVDGSTKVSASCFDKSSIFFSFIDIIFGSPCRKMAVAVKIRHGLDMAGEKFDMPSSPGTLVARALLLVNLQPAQTGSAMSSCCQKRRGYARRWHSAPEP